MADRVTITQLRAKVDYLGRRFNRTFYVDAYSPGDNPYRYKLIEKYEGGKEYETTSHRMTATQFNAYLNGMIDCIDLYATAGV